MAGYIERVTVRLARQDLGLEPASSGWPPKGVTRMCQLPLDMW